MSKEEFLNFPKDKHCTTIFSLAPPGSGKTFIMINAVKWYLEQEKKGNVIFDEYHLVLPAFVTEQDDQYNGLDKIKNVFIYETYMPKKIEPLVKRAKKEAEAEKKAKESGKKIPKRTRVLFVVDDATGQAKALMQCPVAKRIATESRHLNIHCWYLMHHTKGIIPPAVREQTRFCFLYPMQLSNLRGCWEGYINFTEFRTWKDFLTFWDEYVEPQEYGCLLVQRGTNYNPHVSSWFAKK